MSDYMPTLPNPNPPEKPGGNRDLYVWTTLQGLLLGIPYIGASLERFVFGVAQERRWNRLEQTLSEVAEGLRRRDAVDALRTEEFVSLLEVVGPAIGRSTAEVKRQF
jgi:hypothetical protein